jgi:hypothetical protein
MTMFRLRRYSLFLMLALAGTLALACGTSASSTAPSSNEARPAPTAPSSIVDPSTNATGDAVYDPDKIMFDLFPGFGLAGAEQTQDALDLVLEQRDTSQVPVMVEMMRFLPSAKSREDTARVLRELTGQPFDGEQWREWTEWYGRNIDAFPPPEKYLDWKIMLMGQADPRFAQFLRGTEDTAQVSYTELLWGGVIPDGIPDLRNPEHVTPDYAWFLEADERVFGVEINGESRAYPLRIINAHEMVNDTVGGEPVALSWCTLCASGILYPRVINGKETTFGTSGFLYRSNKVMYDRLTNTLWHQQTGEPIIGPLADSGIRLGFLPVNLTTWGEWLAEHPDTTVLSLETGYYSPNQYQREDDSASIYFDYRESEETMFPVWTRDDRLDAKEEVLGISFGDGLKKAYPISTIKARRVINDSIGDTNLVVIGSSASSSARAYMREGNVFGLPDDAPASLPDFLIDMDGVEWQVTDTELVNTADPTQTLRLIPANVSFWFGWYAFNNDTDVYGAGNNG